MSSVLNLVTLGSVGKNNSININDSGNIERGIVCHVDVSDDEIPASFTELDSSSPATMKPEHSHIQNSSSNKNHRASTGSIPNTSTGSMYSLGNKQNQGGIISPISSSSSLSLSKSSCTASSSKSTSHSTSPTLTPKHSPLPKASPILWTRADSLYESLNRAELNLQSSQDFIRRRASTGGEEMMKDLIIDNTLQFKAKSMNDINNEEIYLRNKKDFLPLEEEKSDKDDDLGEIISLEDQLLPFLEKKTHKDNFIITSDCSNPPLNIPLTPPSYDQLFNFPNIQNTEELKDKSINYLEKNDIKSKNLNNETKEDGKTEIPRSTLLKLEKKIDHLKRSIPISNKTSSISSHNKCTPIKSKETIVTDPSKIGESVRTSSVSLQSNKSNASNIKTPIENTLKSTSISKNPTSLLPGSTAKSRSIELFKQKKVEIHSELDRSRRKTREIFPTANNIQVSNIPISISRSVSTPRYSTGTLTSTKSGEPLIRSTSTPRTSLGLTSSSSTPQTCPQTKSKVRTPSTKTKPSSQLLKSSAVLTMSLNSKNSITQETSRNSLPTSMFSPQSVKKARQSLPSSINSSFSNSSSLKISSSTSTTAKRVATASLNFKPRQSLSGLSTEKKSTKLSIGQTSSSLNSLSITKKKELTSSRTVPLDRSEILAKQSSPRAQSITNVLNRPFNENSTPSSQKDIIPTNSKNSEEKKIKTPATINPLELFTPNEINSMRERSRSRSKSKTRSSSITGTSSIQSLTNISSNDLKSLFQTEINNISTKTNRSDSICSLTSISSNTSNSSHHVVQINSSGRIQTNTVRTTKVTSSTSNNNTPSVTITPITSSPSKDTPSKSSSELPPPIPSSLTKKLFQVIQ